MSDKPVTMVRIYLTEGKHQYQELLKLLHDREQIAGVTAFRGIVGFGQSGILHSSSLLDLSLDLPIILEFFDTPEKVSQVLVHLDSLIKPGHIVSWPATVNSGE